jgi:capsular polysaccharide biosynthesis protein
MYIPPEIETTFNQHKDYKTSDLKIRRLKNAFVTYDGLVFKNFMLVDKCAFNIKGKEDNNFYYPFWKDTLEKYAVCKWGESLKSVKLNDDINYLVIHSKWFNYAFWITAYLYRLLKVEHELGFKNIKLILPENISKISFVQDSLKEFDIKHEVIPQDHHVFVKNLIMPELREFAWNYSEKQIKPISKRLVEIAKQKVKTENSPIRIYLTRKQHGIRCIKNEKQLLELLDKHGFEQESFENKNIWEQVFLLNHAEIFISQHGAGLANMMFMEENNHVIELIGKDFAKFDHRFPYYNLAKASGLNYQLFLGNATGINTDDILNDNQLNKSQKTKKLRDLDIEINLNDLEKYLDSITKK